MARQDSKPGRVRSGWDVLTGLGAIVVLLVLVIGPPVALITVFGLPVPHTMPSASLLTHRLGTATVLKACSVVVWLAWLQLVWCVIAEVSAAVRNIGMPRRVPLAGGIQALVHRLVTTALLVSTAAAVAPALAPAAALAATPPTAAALARRDRCPGCRARRHHPRSVAATGVAGRPGGQRGCAPAARPRGRESGVPARQRLPGRQRDAGHRREPGRRSGQVGAPHRKDLRGEAAGGPVPREPVGDRREPPG